MLKTMCAAVIILDIRVFVNPVGGNKFDYFLNNSAKH